MFTVEELSLINLYLDVRQDRSAVIAALEDALPEVDAATRPSIETLLDKLRVASDTDFVSIDFTALWLETVSGD